MKITKLEGCGNDFILTEDDVYQNNPKQFIKDICHRNKGVGADGFVYLYTKEGDYAWDFYNSDGSEAEMCGNAVRCVAAYLNRQKDVKHGNLKTAYGPISFKTKGSVYQVGILENPEIKKIEENIYFTDTGVPHIVCVNTKDEKAYIDKYRYFDNGKNDKGCNITFLTMNKEPFTAKSFERGVENFTLACGTGAVAAGLVANKILGHDVVDIQMPGGALRVVIEGTKVYLEGEAKWIFQGEYENV